jgi:threonine aldolase
VFAVLKKANAEKLLAAGAAFYDWHKPAGFDGPLGEDEGLYRFVASFATTTDDVDKLDKLLAK